MGKKDKKDKKDKKNKEQKRDDSLEVVLDHKDDLKTMPAIQLILDDSGRDNYVISNVRVSYPHLYQPPVFEGKEDKKGVKIVFDNDNERDMAIVDALHKLFVEVGVKKFGDSDSLPDESDWALREKKGIISLNAKTDTQITVVSSDSKKVMQESNCEIYAGCYINLRVAIWGQQNKWGERINCQLISCQFAGDGEPLDGKTVSQTDGMRGFGSMESGPKGGHDL